MRHDQEPKHFANSEAQQRLALGPKPEDAEKRFSEHVAEEIRAGRFVLGVGYFDEGRMFSPDANRYRYDGEGRYSAENYDKKVFHLLAWREFSWQHFKRIDRVKLERGRKDISNLLAPFEIDLLVSAYNEGQTIWKNKQSEKQRNEEAKRQRAAWWP